jgi:hypothetical protein
MWSSTSSLSFVPLRIFLSELDLEFKVLRETAYLHAPP